MAEENKREKRFPCSVCEYGTNNSDNLKRHVKAVHEKIRDQACEQCHMTFSTVSHTSKFHSNLCRNALEQKRQEKVQESPLHLRDIPFQNAQNIVMKDSAHGLSKEVTILGDSTMNIFFTFGSLCNGRESACKAKSSSVHSGSDGCW